MSNRQFLMAFSFSRQEKIEASTDVLKAILKPVIDEVEEISWPLRDPEAVSLMEKVCLVILSYLI